MNTRLAFIAAPILVFAYGVIRIIDGLDGSRGPGVAWTVGHLAFLAALAFFVPVLWHIRRMLGGGKVATVSAVTGTLGIAAATAQLVIDIVVGFMADDRAGMGRLFTQVQDIPLVSPVVYDFGPIFFYIGQLALVIHLALARQVKLWVPLVVLAYIAMPIVNKDLIPVSAVLLLIAFIPLLRPATPDGPADKSTKAAAIFHV